MWCDARILAGGCLKRIPPQIVRCRAKGAVSKVGELFSSKLLDGYFALPARGEEDGHDPVGRAGEDRLVRRGLRVG